MPRPTRRWQYDQVVAPVSTETAPPVPDVCTWFQPASTPIFPRWYAQSTRSTLSGEQPEVSMATWVQPTNQPRAPRFYTQSLNFDVAGSVTSVTVDKFPPIYDALINRRSYAAALSASGSTFVPVTTTPEVITVDKWFHQQPDPVRPPSRAAVLGQSLIDPLALTRPEATSVDKWGQPPSQPTRLPSRTIASGAVSPVPGEFVTVSSWFQNTSQPLHALPRYAALAASGAVLVQFTTAEVVTIDKWFHQQPDPPRRPARVADGEVVIDPRLLTRPEAVSVDKFKPTYPDRVYGRVNSAYLRASGAVLVIPEAITVDRWQPSYPDRIRAHAQEPHSLIVLPTGEITTVDRWRADYPDVINRRGIHPSSAAGGKHFLNHR